MAGSGNIVVNFTISGNSKSMVAAANKAAAALGNFNRQLMRITSKTTNTNVGSAASNALGDQKAAIAQAQRLGNQIGSSLNQAYSKMVQGGMGMVNAFRFLTQGVSELTRVMTTFISLPMAAAFSLGAKTAIDFESAMVRVGKTTGITGKRLEDLRSWIRDFSKSTVSSNTDLATFAEQLGQIGVNQTRPMQMMIRTVEMMASATDLSADEVTKAIGRIGTAFGYDLNTEAGAKSIHQLANAVNYLENTTAASAGEIVEGLLNVASVGGMLKIPVQDMAAIVAMMESMGVSADAVGNRLARWYQQIIEKSDKAAQLMKGFTTTTMNGSKRTYSGSGDELLAWVNEDKAQVLMDFSTAMSQVNDEARTTALKEWFDVFGQVGAKVGVLSGNVTSFTDALRGARQEFAAGNSLFSEYDKSLMTTDAHLKILRNNAQDLGVTFGDAFLPVINRIIEYVIPGIKMLTLAFKKLSWENKLLVVGIPLLVMVLSPVLFILAQVGHAIGMVGMGFFSFLGAIGKFGGVVFSMFKAVSGIVKLFGTLGTAGAAVGGIFSGLGPILLSVVGALATLGIGIAAFAGIGAMVGKALQSMGVDVAGFFTRLAQAAKTWGENMMATYAGGLLGGAARFIAKALSAIATMIARFFEAHSPPKEGPLSTIDKWGGPLFSTFLRGFYDADFSILSDVGGMIKDALSSVFSGAGDGKDSAVATALSAARVQLAQLISTFNKTGKISEDVLSSIVSGTGALSEDFKTLIRLSVQYEASQRRLKDLEKQRTQANKDYGAQVADIASSSLTAEQKAARIRSAIYSRNSSLDRIDKETAAEEEKSSVLKEQVDWQKNYIKAQLDQASVIDSVKASLGGLADTISSLDFGGAAGKAADSVTSAFDNFTTTIQDRIQSAQTAIDMFLKGFRGEKMGAKDLQIALAGGELDPETFGEMQKAYDLGKKIHDTLDNINLIFQGKKSLLPPLLSPEDQAKADDLLGKLSDIGKVAGGFGGGFAAGFAPFGKIMGQIIEYISKEPLKGFLDWLMGKKEGKGGDIDKTVNGFRTAGQVLGTIGGALATVALTIISLPLIIGTHIRQSGKKMIAAWGEAILFIQGLGPKISLWVRTAWTNVVNWLSTLKDQITQKITEAWQGAMDFLASLPGRIGELVVQAAYWIGYGIGQIALFFSSLPERVREGLATLGTKIGEAMTAAWNSFIIWGTETLPEWIAWFAGLAPAAVAALAALGTDVQAKIAEGWETVKGWFPGALEEWKGKFGEFVTSVVTIMSGLGKAIADALVTGIPDLLQGISNLLSAAWQKVTAFLEKVRNALATGVNAGLTGREVGKNSDGSPDYDGDPSTPFAKGGIVFGPTRALIGEAGPEMVLPLSHLPMLLNRINELNSMAGGALMVQINNPTVRSEQDLVRLTRQVKESVRSGIRDTKRYKGR